MAITSAICNSWVRDLGIKSFSHSSTGDTFRAALFNSSVTLSKSTTAYSTGNEISGTGYSAGGVAISSVIPALSGDTVVFDWDDAAWSSATLSDVRGVMVYDDTHASNASVFVLDFGGAQSVTAGTLTVQWPAADASNAIVRL